MTADHQTSSALWYPGHMAQWRRQLDERLKTLDVVLLVVDARAPRATCPQGLLEAVGNKPVLILLNKTDLADANVTVQWVRFFERQHPTVSISATHPKGAAKSAILSGILNAYQAKASKQSLQGLKPRPARAMAFGVPNVGKSSLINALVGAKKVRTASKAGVTRTSSWVRVHPQVDLLDTPGLYPLSGVALDAHEPLSLIRSVGEAVVKPEDVAQYLVTLLCQRYSAVFSNWFGHPIDPEAPLSLETIARAKLWLSSGGEPDVVQTAQRLLKLFRDGKLGKFTLEIPLPL
ncbi:MAG: ribosome biogenesis GTPase YlqF [Vampirovibrionales bacterium]|nr:ribosome biogenesis GTPase YlqF [Vampirovibrionales bacterium]